MEYKKFPYEIKKLEKSINSKVIKDYSGKKRLNFSHLLLEKKSTRLQSLKKRFQINLYQKLVLSSI